MGQIVTIKLLVYSIIGSIALCGPVLAGPADKYVKNLVGKWRGDGIVAVSSKGKKVKLRCKSTNTLDEKKRKLSMRGRCASSQGTRALSVSIGYTVDGKRLNRISYQMAGRGGGSNGQLRGNTLTLNGSVKSSQGGKIPTRSRISGVGGNYSITFFARIDGKWKNRGSLKFRR